MNDLIKLTPNKDIEYSSFVLHKNGLSPIGTPTFEQWQECWFFVGKADGAVRFWRGDLIRYAENAYGEMYTQFINDTGKDYFTLAHDKSVADRIDICRRRQKLSFQHHQEVVYLEPKEQDELLDMAENNNINSKDFRQVVREYKNKKEIALLPPIDKTKFQKQVIRGDCIGEMKKLPDKSIDMIYADPPYGVDKDTWDTFREGEFLPFTLNWIKECLRLLKNKSHFFIHFPSEKSAWLENLIITEFNITPVSRIVWANRSLPMGRDATNKFLSTYQPILHYNFGDKPLNFTPEWNDERFDVWTIAIPQTNYKDKKLHITQKPLELMDRLVRFGSREGEIVLDPMAGSGTTGVACIKNNRDFILIEREPKYIEIIQRRLNDI
jgi:adenine-specific DNA-methyltransferase